MSGKAKTTEAETVVAPEAAAVEAVTVEQANTQTSGENDGQQPAQPARTFTQSELNAIIQQRVEQERRKYADYDTLKQQVTALQTGQQSQQQQVQQLEQQNQQLTVQSRGAAIEAAIAKAAGAIGLDPEAAMKLGDLSKVTVNEDGSVANAAEVVKAVSERYPGLLGRRLPVVAPVNGAASVVPTQAEREAQFRQEMFGGNARGFWGGGGVVLPTSLFDE